MIGRKKSLLHLIIRFQATTLLYFVVLFAIYTLLFFFASISWLIEALQYLLPLLTLGGILILVNFLRMWRQK